MTHEQTNPPPEAPSSRDVPPPDDIMAKVLAPFFGFDTIEAWTEGMDPRVCTDAALELMCFLFTNRGLWQRVEEPMLTADTEWEVRDFDSCVDSRTLGHEIRCIPPSGQPFRTAVCWLAVDVLGVG